MNYGDIGRRIVAELIDSFLIGLISTVLTWLSFQVFGFSFAFLNLVLYVIFFTRIIYYVAFEGSSMHATPGKRVMELYIVDHNGNGITYATSILRYIGKMISGAVAGLGYLLAVFSDDKQALHDMLAKTYVLSGTADNASYNRRPYRGSAQRRSGNGSGREIVAVTGPLAGTVYSVDESGVVIGREAVSCNIVIPKSQGKVSRVHCYVTYNPMSGVFVLNDRNSSHGTYLANGKKVAPNVPAALNSGDRFYLSTPSNTFEVR